MEVKIKFDEVNIKEEKNPIFVKVLMLKGEKGDTVSASWGTITGNISSQTDLKNALDNKANSNDLSSVATSGDYNDLLNKPSIPTKTSDLNNDSGFIGNTVNNLTNYTNNTDLAAALSLKANNTDLEKVKSAIDYKTTDYIGDIVVESIKTTNLFNKNQLIGLVQINSSGGYIADQTSYINYIEVEAGKTYTISANLNRQWVYNFSNNIPAIGSSGNTRTVAAGTSITFTVPSGYKYFCLRGYPDGASSQECNLSQNIKLEEGSTATTFTKYQNLDNYEYYSTGEILIGTWIDGKPLYRKCYNVSSLPNNTSAQIINLSDIPNRDFVRINYGVSYCTWGLPRTYPVFRYQGLETIISSSKNVDCTTTFDGSCWSAFIVVEYTKTTD